MSPKKKKNISYICSYVYYPFYRHKQRRMAFLANSIISFLYASFRCVSDASQSEGDLEIKEK